MESALNLGSDTAWIASRLAAALVAGAILGINRDIHHKAAGLRTMALVSTGSAVVVMASLLMTHGSADSASRVIQGLMTGWAFSAPA